jgi:hypothetical protein
MPIEKGPRFAQGDLYVDYPFEDVMYRWDHLKQQVFVKFDGQAESPEPVPHDNRLFNDSLLFGDEINQAAYLKGRDRAP